MGRRWQDPVAWAISQIGVSEAPPGSNDGPPMVYALEGETPAPWCGRFVRAAFIACARPLPGNRWKIPEVAELQRALVGAGAWIPVEEVREGRTVNRGDLILLHGRGGSDAGRGNHVGIVERMDGDDVVSVDGNWGDRVARVRRPLGSALLWGFGRWPPRS